LGKGTDIKEQTVALSRRKFLSGIVPAAAAGGLFLNQDGLETEAGAGSGQSSEKNFQIFPVGRIEKKDKATCIRIYKKYADGLLGLDGWSHVNVFYWFDKNDVSHKRGILRVRPRGNSKNPLTGVFACRAPVRPNLIALSVCRILSIKGNVITVDKIDAFDATPVIDLKPYIPPDAPTEGVEVPLWAKREKKRPL
jgi:tRNA (adenine37-N6)-methyltransferase